MTQWAYFAARDGNTTRGEVTAPDEDEARRLAFHEIAKAFRMAGELDTAASGEDWDYFQGELDGFELDEEPPQDPLIAAAPAMLAALQELVRCVRGGDETAGFSMDDALEDANNAIALATGKRVCNAEGYHCTPEAAALLDRYNAPDPTGGAGAPIEAP